VVHGWTSGVIELFEQVLCVDSHSRECIVGFPRLWPRFVRVWGELDTDGLVDIVSSHGITTPPRIMLPLQSYGAL